MPDDADRSTLQPLLSSGEPSPYFVMHPGSKVPVVLVCDHASNRFPEVLGNLGLNALARQSHLAVDIGAGPLTEYVADSLGATAVLAQYSRLVVDCNRDLEDASAFLDYGDGFPVPGNRGLCAAEKRRRAETIHGPYHAAIDTELDRLAALHVEPLFIGVHSFTPVLNGVPRPWEIGILWDRDRGLHVPFLEGFRQAGFATGDNEPYSGRAPEDYTIDHHAEARSLPCIGFEVRQDLVSDAAGIARVGDTLCRIIEHVLVHGVRPRREKMGSEYIFESKSRP